MSEGLMPLATKCLDICQALESKGKAFTFHLSFTMWPGCRRSSAAAACCYPAAAAPPAALPAALPVATTAAAAAAVAAAGATA